MINATRQNDASTQLMAMATSVVFGTADFAVRLGAVCEMLPVHEIAARLVALVAGDDPKPMIKTSPN